MRNWQKTCAACCSAVLLAAAACTRDAPALPDALSVHEAWARPADSGAVTAVYFTLVNGGELVDTLAAVSSLEAELAEMHISTQRANMMSMSSVTTLPVPPMDSVMFRPLGAHVMLTRLRRPLAEGDSVDLMLQFGSGRTVSVRAGVRQP